MVTPSSHPDSALCQSTPHAPFSVGLARPPLRPRPSPGALAHTLAQGSCVEPANVGIGGAEATVGKHDASSDVGLGFFGIARCFRRALLDIRNRDWAS